MQHKLDNPFCRNNAVEFGFEWELIKVSDQDYDKEIVQARTELEEIKDKSDDDSRERYPKLLVTLAKAYLVRFSNELEVPPNFKRNNNLIVLVCAILGLKSRLGDKATFHKLASTACSNLSQLDMQGFKMWPQTLENLFPMAFTKSDEAKSYCQNMLMISANRHSRCAALRPN